MTHIERNLARITSVISDARDKSKGKPTLVGVTKSLSVETISELMRAGLTCFGENRVQEFLPKYEALTDAQPTWHFIGHLQRNKVKFIIDKVVMIHSVDNLPLAQEINKRAAQTGRIMDILIEVNIASEDTKHGVAPEEAISLARALAPLSNIQVKGLMCIAPFVENAEDNRIHFKNMRNLLVDINAQHPHNLTELSMGMSGDYHIAISEGSTMVRIGTALVSKEN